ncbi:MAG: rhamnogalacturonan acetylesterase, partial [Bacilli bacterium]|nr:rhamnogalacturonan acetylesterase [Bacilli bacterium]
KILRKKGQPKLRRSPLNQVNERIQLFIAGDSTAANYPAHQAPMAGWGQLLNRFFSENVEIRNEARCGRSSKSFILEGHVSRIWENIRPNDYLLIQFGHNDEKPQGTDPFSTYQEYLTRYIEEARNKYAFPVQLTPVQRRFFEQNGQLKQTHGEYSAAMKQLAQRMEVLLLDLCRRTEALFESYGPERQKLLLPIFH